MWFVVLLITSCVFVFVIFYLILLNKNSKKSTIISGGRDEIGLILEKEKFHSAVEVGVQNGYFSDKLISKWNSCKLYVMVDPWIQQRYYDDAANVDNNKQNKIFQNAMEVVKKYSDKVEFIILRTTSEVATKYLKYQLYDFIYLDGRHDYESVKQDINWYYPFVKPGGILAGHDYQDQNRNEWRMNGKGNINYEKKAVKSAVDEFANHHKLFVNVTSEKEFKSWIIRKPFNTN